ncbi:SpoIIE family protein phosphatase [Spartinivicinus poritis]|uniref:SpoIIE family protein phosphatase n=1 Tax=Spartinivicinus poritis TaxID=2994640 RepID=A0ABT5UDD6_9GAMM|nr:SpoIIE family protein phosphatase [Spartinivicinus sp. A2-2]MDE1464388.1 SpoIIE family protein phosphatase [Spartinivicinus sp. A2-2]
MTLKFMDEQQPASFNNIRQLRLKLTTILSSAHLPEDAQQNFTLAFSEIATNVVKYSSPPAKSIQVVFFQEANRWVLQVFDDGGPFTDFASKLKTSQQSLNSEELHEGGVGLGIVSSRFPSFQYTAASDKQSLNCFEITKLYSPLNKPSVAIIDDDATTLAILKHYLKDNYQVSVYQNPSKAVTDITRHPVNIVISDMEMPGLNGLEVRQRFAANQSTSHMPFIFLTGHAETEFSASHAGIDDFLIKPTKQEKLIAAIERSLSRSKHIKATLGDKLDHDVTNTLRVQVPPKLGQFELALKMEAATAGGGDFIYKSADQHTIILGDVMGHGEQAKFFAHAFAGFFHGLFHACTQHYTDPGEILTALSKAAETNDVMQATIVTCIALRIIDEQTLLISSAAHPAPLFISGGHIEDIECSGPLPGLMPDVAYHTTQVVFHPGQQLILYTDGLFESAKTPKGRKQLEKTVKNTLLANCTKPVAEAIENVYQAFQDQATKPLPDDISILMLGLA